MMYESMCNPRINDVDDMLKNGWALHSVTSHNDLLIYHFTMEVR